MELPSNFESSISLTDILGHQSFPSIIVSWLEHELPGFATFYQRSLLCNLLMLHKHNLQIWYASMFTS